MGILKQTSFDVPVIVVGNLSAGGTGKSPLVQYLASSFSKTFKVAILSRGYGRISKGYVGVEVGKSALQTGDEPLQYAHMLPGVNVAVCEKRVPGIEQLLKLIPRPEIILLDDAFQHRYVKPTYSIILTDYQYPYFSDSLLPAGRLRETKSSAARANAVVVSKCPENLSAKECREFAEKLSLNSNQSLFFSYIHYCELLFNPNGSPVSLKEIEGSGIFLLCGIANPAPLVQYISGIAAATEQLIFPDHHQFTVADIVRLKSRFNQFEKLCKTTSFLLTTRKDYMRLLNEEFRHHLSGLPLLVIDIEPRFLPYGEGTLFEHISNFLRKN